MTGVVLNRPLTLEGVVRLADGSGGFSESWATLGTLWAEVVPGAGRDVAGEEAFFATTPFRITVRAAPQGAPSRPRPDQRFRDGSRLFLILAVTERDAQGHYLMCFSREEVPA